MGKDKEPSGFKVDKKRKKKDKDRYVEEIVSKKKKRTSETEEIPQRYVEKSKTPKKNKAASPYESPKKKSKRDVELTENEFSPRKKSKKNKSFTESSPKWKLDESPSKKHKNISMENSDSDAQSDDHLNLDSSMKQNILPKNIPPIGNDVVSSENHIIEDELGWTKEDVITLLQRIDTNLPEKDSLKYCSRVERLDWNQIKFNDHTPEECKEKWKIIEKKVRGFRILKEMVGDAKLWVEKPWANFYSSQKQKRHPDMPKRPLSSYMLFYMAKKSKLAKKHPNLPMIDLSKLVAEKFHKLPDSKKEKYAEKARILREEYNEKMKFFLDTHPNESMAILKKKKDQKNQMPGPPKPLSPLKLFIEEKLKYFEVGDSKVDSINQIKEMWRHLSNKKKVPWIRWAHENEKKYLEELEIYKSENPNFEMPKIKPLLSKEEITILERMEGKPEKPPNSAYSLFSRLMLKDDQIKLMKFSPKERMREISRLWAAVSDEDKKQYQEKAKNMLDTYKLEYATYLESLPEDKRQEELAKSLGRKRKKKPDIEIDSNGKKLKQTKIVDAFKLNEKTTTKAPAPSDEESGDIENEDSDEEDDDLENNPKKVNEIKKKLQRLEPPKPPNDPYELFKKVYLMNPGNKISHAETVWNSMPKKEQERYKRKLENQKQNYILSYKDFLTNLMPFEIKVYSMMKNESLGCKAVPTSEGEESDDEAEDESSDDKNKIRNVSTNKTEDSSSDSEESD